MKKQKGWYWPGGGAFLVFTGLLVGGLALLGLLPWQHGDFYEDPQGRYTIEVGPSWEQVETDASYAHFVVPDPPLQIYTLSLQANTVDDAFTQAMEVIGFDPGLLQGGAVAMIGDWQAYTQEDAAGFSYGLAGKLEGENAYLLVARADRAGVGVENEVVMRALSSLKIIGKEETVIKNYADLEALVKNQVDRLAGSVSVAVIHHDSIVYTYVYGQANPIEGIAADTQTIYRFGSMTKPVTATALMQLVEQGKVDLDVSPGKYIPEFPKHWNVTVRQLLNHSACMADHQRLSDGLIAKPGEVFDSLEEVFANYVKDYPDLVCEPGKVSQYSNPHYLALARIIEEVSGQPYETYVVDHILTPLEMESAHFQFVAPDKRYAKGQFPVDKIDRLVAQLNAFRGPGQEDLILHRGETFSTLDNFRVLAPWGGMLGTPSDVTRFLQMQMNGGRYGNTQIIKAESIAAMQKMQTSTDGSPLGLGLSWWIGEDDLGRFYYHSGGGHTIENTMRFYPDLDLGVVVMGNVNGYQAEMIAEGLVNAWKHEK